VRLAVGRVRTPHHDHDHDRGSDHDHDRGVDDHDDRGVDDHHRGVDDHHRGTINHLHINAAVNHDDHAGLDHDDVRHTDDHAGNAAGGTACSGGGTSTLSRHRRRTHAAPTGTECRALRGSVSVGPVFYE